MSSCTTTSCCKINTCIPRQQLDCSGTSVAGAKNLQIAVLCAVALYTTATGADGADRVDSITMNDTTHDPTNGDDDHLFYNVCPSDDTLGVTTTWDTDEESDTVSFTYTIVGRFKAAINTLLTHKLSKLIGKEIICRFQENGTGLWYWFGIDGGIKFKTVNMDWGVKKTDPKFTDFTITGTTTEPHEEIFATDTATTTTLIDDTSFSCT